MTKKVSISMPRARAGATNGGIKAPSVNAVEEFVNAGAERSAKPLLMPLNLIDEDPDQVRRVFDEQKLNELAASIKVRGVKTPISIRPHPQREGRYIINHGARRYRGSKLAGKDTIPAYVDEAYTEDDQAVENLQRDDLTPREVAEYLDRRLKQGAKKNEIATAIGKSPSYVTKHLALLNLPDPIAAAFNSGAIVDVNLLYQLSVLFKDAPTEVTDWLDYNAANLTRDSLKRLQAEIEAKRAGQDDDSGAEQTEEPAQQSAEGNGEADGAPVTLRRPQLLVKVDGASAELLFKRRPQDSMHAWVQREDGTVDEVALSSIELVALQER